MTDRFPGLLSEEDVERLRKVAWRQALRETPVQPLTREQAEAILKGIANTLRGVGIRIAARESIDAEYWDITEGKLSWFSADSLQDIAVVIRTRVEEPNDDPR
jgi:hypothetical protein